MFLRRIDTAVQPIKSLYLDPTCNKNFDHISQIEVSIWPSTLKGSV